MSMNKYEIHYSFLFILFIILPATHPLRSSFPSLDLLIANSGHSYNPFGGGSARPAANGSYELIN